MNHQFEHEQDAVRLSLDLLKHKHLRGYRTLAPSDVSHTASP
ncbi:hypothetical protein [Rhizobium sp. Rhizsp42]|jgi:predicted DNA-binding WGR domain protein